MRKKMKMTEKIEALKFMAQIHRQQFDERRKYEWKAFYTSLTFFVLLGATKFNKDVLTSAINENSDLIIIGSLSILLVSIVFLVAAHFANRVNKSIAVNAENLLSDLIANNPIMGMDIFSSKELSPQFKKTNQWLIKGLWSLVFQIISLIVVCLISLFVLFF